MHGGWGGWDESFGPTGGGGFGGGGRPQNDVPVDDLRDRVQNMLNNSTCATFIARLLGTVSQQNPTNSAGQCQRDDGF